MITPENRKKLLNLAKSAVSSYLNKIDLEIDEALKNNFSDKQGVFVTLTKNDQLRGCIGFTEPIFPLYEAIVKAAKSAAFSDPRFMPLQQEEFNEIKFEISVLSVPELIEDDYLNNINIGEDGLIINNPSGSGLLLPQVFSRDEYDPKKALETTCTKAMLPTDVWKDEETKVYKFQAEIFSEH
ncbi:AmmeMemoRadiSam system protein A [Candidatus Woesearchaeota archaeon]|nr:AmmeMemoRadiSam system protein A [Candidatus Woesearchaeota archaeon]